MENGASADFSTTIFFKRTELEFVMNLLEALKLRGILDFDVDNRSEFMAGCRHITAKELNAIIEKSEQGEDISAEEFQKHFAL